jgi:hypothetical protein
MCRRKSLAPEKAFPFIVDAVCWYVLMPLHEQSSTRSWPTLFHAEACGCVPALETEPGR